jgi:bifunctional NMN adenylyltransferase/nudix hydrolase
MRKKYDLAVYIGRFQPFHNGHAHVINKAFQAAERVLILVGSAETAPNIKNPFPFYQRKVWISKWIQNNFAGAEFEVRPLSDQIYNEALWISSVQEAVEDYANGDKKIVLVGLDKDDSTYYLRSFPQWDFLAMEPKQDIDATGIRKVMFEDGHLSTWTSKIRPFVPPEILRDIELFGLTQLGNRLRDEYYFVKDYKKSWESAPYPPTFVTVDAVVICSGHILVVKRGAHPGMGLYALPGGFVNQNETLKAACLRELREETRLKIPEKVLSANCVGPVVFDKPDRSLRGRTITHAYRFNFPEGPLPNVRGSDDATDAFWMPISEIKTNESSFYEDHWHIINYFVNQA